MLCMTLQAVEHWLHSENAKRNLKAVLAFKGSDGFSALHFAARHGSAHVAKLLLAAGADPYAKEEYGKLAHHYAEVQM